MERLLSEALHWPTDDSVAPLTYEQFKGVLDTGVLSRQAIDNFLKRRAARHGWTQDATRGQASSEPSSSAAALPPAAATQSGSSGGGPAARRAGGR